MDEYSHFQHDLPASYVDLLSIRVFDGWIITLDPDILHKLCGETAFADSSCVGGKNNVSDIWSNNEKFCTAERQPRWKDLPAPSTTM